MLGESDMLYTTLAAAAILKALGSRTPDSVACSVFDVLLYKVSSVKSFGMLLSLTSCQLKFSACVLLIHILINYLNGIRLHSAPCTFHCICKVVEVTNGHGFPC